ncbi:MAG: phosphotransferase [Polyangia bacterium]
MMKEHGLDLAALERWLATQVAVEGPLVAERIGGGQSNPTFHVRAANDRYVLRMKPPGVLVPSAHAVEREYLVMRALATTDVPVPPLVGLCEDASVLGTAFYVMKHVDGRILWDPALPEVDEAARGAMYESLNRVLASIHAVDLVATGLGDYGRPGNYFERQVGRWSKQYRATSEFRIESMDRLCDWLAAHIPDSDETALIHGDYRLDNVMFHPSEPRIVAVLDWELSTLGHPLADVAYQAMTWRFSPGDFRGMGGRDLAALGIPSERAYVEAYCARTGRSLPRRELWEFAIACSMFRLAAILHGIALRATQGNAVGDDAAATGKRARVIADLAWLQVEQLR